MKQRLWRHKLESLTWFAVLDRDAKGLKGKKNNLILYWPIWLDNSNVSLFAFFLNLPSPICVIYLNPHWHLSAGFSEQFKWTAISSLSSHAQKDTNVFHVPQLLPMHKHSSSLTTFRWGFYCPALDSPLQISRKQCHNWAIQTPSAIKCHTSLPSTESVFSIASREQAKMLFI